MKTFTKKRSVNIIYSVIILIALGGACLIFTAPVLLGVSPVRITNLNFRALQLDQKVEGTNLKVVTAECPNPDVQCEYFADRTTNKIFDGRDYIISGFSNYALLELKGSKYIVLENTGGDGSEQTNYAYVIFKFDGDNILAAKFISSGLMYVSPVNSRTMSTRNRLLANSEGFIITNEGLNTQGIWAAIFYNFLPANAGVELMD
jgi:hypothetical protein